MDFYIDTVVNLNDHAFLEKLEWASLESFANSQISMLGFYDNWLRMLGGSLVKVPEQERFVLINHLWKFSGCGKIENSKLSQFTRLLRSMKVYGDLAPYQRCESHQFLTSYIFRTKDQIPRNSWIYCVAMFCGILYTKSAIDRKVIKYLSEHRDVSVGFLDTYDDAMDFVGICRNYFRSNKDEVVNGFKFGYDAVVDFYNGLSSLLFEEVETVIQYPAPVYVPIEPPVITIQKLPDAHCASLEQPHVLEAVNQSKELELIKVTSDVDTSIEMAVASPTADTEKLESTPELSESEDPDILTALKLINEEPAAFTNEVEQLHQQEAESTYTAEEEELYS